MKAKTRKRQPRLRRSLRLLVGELAVSAASGTEDRDAIRAACRNESEYVRAMDRWAKVHFGKVKP